MNLKPFTGPGSTPSRRRFWDKVTQAVIASQKVAGRHVTVDEHQGMGTVINVADTSARRGGGTPSTDLCVTFSGITSPCGCVVSIGRGRKIYHLEGLNGTYQVPLTSPNSWYLFIADGSSCWNVERWLDDCTGEPIDTISGTVEVFVDFDGTDYLIRLRTTDDAASSAFYGSGPGPTITDTHSCGDSTDIGTVRGIDGIATISAPPCESPNPCSGLIGACCVGVDCTIETEEDCIAMEGIYQGDGTFCHPPPCGGGACCDYDNSTCEITLEADCIDPLVYLGDGTICDDCGF